MGWFAALSAGGGIITASIRFLFPNILYEPLKAYKIGKPQDYSEGVSFDPDKNIFVVHHDNTYKVLSAVCTHLGCTPNWVENTKQFQCPCHGSIFNEKGVKISGPAPDPLPWYTVTISADGRLFVDESRIVEYSYALKV